MSRWAEISFAAGESRSVTAFIVDVGGRVVRTLIDGVELSGPQRITWDGRDDQGYRLPSGVYFARVHVGGETVVRQLVVTR
jgi:flagellar hook assembly protein FlgD